MKFINGLLDTLFNTLNSDEFDGTVRHAITYVGGLVTAAGIASNDQWTVIGAGIATGLTVVWSWASKKYIKAQAVVKAVTPNA